MAKSGVIALNVNQRYSNEIADILDKEYEICCRGGFHCAPLAHRFLKTETQGAVRLSIGYFNTLKDIKHVIKALAEIAKK
jgi:selenocysteine lyase/cysteine desulfurase